MTKSFFTLIRSSEFLSSHKLWISIGISVIASGFIIPVGYFVKLIFDKSIPERNLQTLIQWGLISIAILILNSFFSVLARNHILKYTKGIVLKIRLQLANKLLHGSHTYYQHADLSRIHKVMVYDTEKIDNLANALFSQIIPAVITGGAIILILLFLDWQMTAVLLLLGLIIISINERLHKASKRSLAQFQIAFESFHKKIWFILEANQLIKISSSQQREYAVQEKILHTTNKASLEMVEGFTRMNNYQELIFSISSILLLMFGGFRVLQNTMTIGSLLSFYFCMYLLKRYLTNISNSLPPVIEGLDSLNQCSELLSSIEVESNSGKTKPDFTGRIDLKNISFSFPKMKLYEDFNLQLAPGKILLLTGANGSGKSTLVNLVLNLYQPTKGSLQADDIPYSELDISFLRSKVSVVFQENVIFNGSILENIQYVKPDATADEILEAIRLSNLDHFINSLPSGMDTFVGEKGVRLSGGQKQKIALARCFLLKSPFIIMDEPTNHLDQDSIIQIMNAIRSLEHKPSVLLVSHDVQLSEYADYSFNLK